MKRALVAVYTTLILLSGAFLLVSVDICYADTAIRENYEIHAVQDGNSVALSVINNSDSEILSVTWDLGDGRVLHDPSIQTSFKSGLWKITAVVNSSVQLVRYVGIYDDGPPTDVERNREYRYGVFATDPELIVRNSQYEKVSWLKYDSENRALIGTPEIPGQYSVWFNGQFWKINIVDTGAKKTKQAKFNVSADEGRITAHPDTQDNASRYSWSVRSIDGDLVAYHEGRNLDVEVLNGYYTVHLQHIGISGSSNYSKIIFVDGEVPVEEPPEETKSYTIPLILGIVTVILLMVATMTYSPLAATSSAISAIVAILMVIA